MAHLDSVSNQFSFLVPRSSPLDSTSGVSMTWLQGLLFPWGFDAASSSPLPYPSLFSSLSEAEMAGHLDLASQVQFRAGLRMRFYGVEELQWESRGSVGKAAGATGTNVDLLARLSADNMLAVGEHSLALQRQSTVAVLRWSYFSRLVMLNEMTALARLSSSSQTASLHAGVLSPFSSLSLSLCWLTAFFLFCRFEEVGDLSQ